jgi:protein ImuB
VEVVRTLSLWWPDWPVVVARRLHPELADVPVAVFEHGFVLAASQDARVEGVRRGHRRRDAQARCPDVAIVEVDHAAGAVAFEAVARALEAITPRVALERPGVLSFPTRGPSRYFGGDDALAMRVLALADPSRTARVGIADGPFAAALAARAGSTDDPVTVVAPGGTAAFLAPKPVTALERADLADVLHRLGVHTLGEFAALPSSAVLARFGSDGLLAHRLACGLDEQPADLRVPPPDLEETAELDPPAERVDIAMFAGKALADRLLGRLAERGLVCTRVEVVAETEHGERIARSWRHDGALTPHALAERVRWQLDAWLTQAEATAGLTLLRLVPEEVLPASGRQLGFWGGDPAAADRAARSFARVQGMLGHAAVTTAVVQGGRTPNEQIAWVPWGEPRDPRRPLSHPAGGALLDQAPLAAADGAGAPIGTAMSRQAKSHQAWPGAVPAPAPGLVFDPPVPAEFVDATGADVRVSGRGDASAPPARIRCAELPNGGGVVVASAGPWVHDVRWWDPSARRRRALWQVVIAAPTGETACLVAVERGLAAVEAIYD